ncbi:peptide-methionine (R)-S-oxide reductase [Streptomyces mirabilis]|uniref:hypothetical protein n=1 Tax=Streptomyces mirabilis TaxID=68239 RepID=UPI0036C0CD96
MPEIAFDFADTAPADEWVCCPNAFTRPIDGGFEIEDPRHGGPEVCCLNSGAHTLLNVQEWHEEMDRYERALLDDFMRLSRFLQTA